MKVYICSPNLTMNDTIDAEEFLKNCKEIFDVYIKDILYINSDIQIKQILAESIDKNDIFIFFNSEKGNYTTQILKLIKEFFDCQCRIWPIAMYSNWECRMPPSVLAKVQSFDVSCRNENRNPLKNNIKAISQILARKVIAQVLSPLYRDEVLYFISHRRIDGEHIAAKLADEFRLLTRERNVYRDVVNIAVGDDAQKDIDKNLCFSDVVIFLQTQESQYSDYIIKELCYALVNDIPVLWIQIDSASYSEMPIRPGDKPVLSYSSKDFDNPSRLEEIVDEIEEKCFSLIMNSSNQVFSYIEYLNDMRASGKVDLVCDVNSILAYYVKYVEANRDRYSSGEHCHYVQCYGRNPQKEDINKFMNRIKDNNKYDKYEKFFLLSNHGKVDISQKNGKFFEENFEDYLAYIESKIGKRYQQLNKRIIISGAFPDNDEIYKNSLIEALMIYSREIVKRGYTLVFGAHPTFQELIFKIGELYSSNVKYSIEMHMDKAYIHMYNKDTLEKQCALQLADGLHNMRENMICRKKGELLICLGGKIKNDKTQQGVDVEINLAKSVGMPVALVGTVGGRSSEYAYEVLINNDWSKLNNYNRTINEGLFYNVNHKLMAKRLLDCVEQEALSE